MRNYKILTGFKNRTIQDDYTSDESSQEEEEEDDDD